MFASGAESTKKLIFIIFKASLQRVYYIGPTLVMLTVVIVNVVDIGPKTNHR